MSPDIDLYYSVKLRRNLSEATTLPPGAAHYSYSLVAQKFLDMFHGAGLVPVELERPEIYVTPPHGIRKRAVHIMFKPFQELRLLKKAHNIAHVAWEFEDLPRLDSWAIGDERRRDPFADYIHMLSLPDRVWVGCQFSKSVFSKFGISNVDVVPAPIETPTLGRSTLEDYRRSKARIAISKLKTVKAVRLSSNLLGNPDSAVYDEHVVSATTLVGADRNVFLLVANPGDLRKNLPALIDGFSLAAQADPTLVLLIKLTIDNKHVTLPGVLKHQLPRLYANEELALGDVTPTNIFLINDYLDSDRLQALYWSADFYLSAAIAEGQNLPLQEAMAIGTIPVVANHTAMADYVTADNAVLIDWQPRRATSAFEHAYGLRDFSVPHIDAHAVTRAVKDAARLSVTERTQKREHSAKVIRDCYANDVIATRVSEVLTSA